MTYLSQEELRQQTTHLVTTTHVLGRRYRVKLTSRPEVILKGTDYRGRGGYRVHDINKKSRVYVSAPNPKDLGLGESPDSGMSDDGGLNDRAWKMYNRLEIEVMREWVKAVIADSVKLSFSKKAGCTMCPCSPGFVVKEGLDTGFNFWIHVEAF